MGKDIRPHVKSEWLVLVKVDIQVISNFIGEMKN